MRDIIKSFFGKLGENLALWWKRFHLTKILIVLLLIVTLGFEIFFVINAKTTDVSNLMSDLQQTTVVYDQEGVEVGKLTGDSGTYVTVDDISDNVVYALIATEDQRFYSHKGFDPIGIGRAAVKLIINRGQIAGGGSTITQQLVKNAFLTNEQSMMRKGQELFIALEVEKTYSKDQILEMYLNNSYFGNGVWGIEDAAKKYFGKSASDLDVAESATLVGALKGPNLYNPVDDYDAAISRRNTVLSLMVSEGYIDQATVDSITSVSMSYKNNPVDSRAYHYPAYFDAVIEEAINKYKISEEELVTGGYKVYTALNRGYQDSLDSVYSNEGLFPVSPGGERVQSATVVMDPYTGGVEAIRGSNRQPTYRGFNRATQMKRSPGSVIKPLAVYTPALKQGYTYDSVLEDEVKSYGSDKYRPENWNYETQGEIPLWQAVAESKNTSAVWLLDKIGIAKGTSALNDFGLKTVEEDHNLSIALGALHNGTSPLEISSAYTAFVNDGQRSEGYFIQRIEDPDGKIVVDSGAPKQNKVMSPEIAEEMTSIMMSVYSPYGTGSSSYPAGYQLAGKTGSTELVSDTIVGGETDNWRVAYTPDMIVTSWIGFDETSGANYIPSGSSMSEMFKVTMEGLLQASPQTKFEIDSVVEVYNQQSNPDIQTDNQPKKTQKTDDFWTGVKDFFGGLLSR